MNRRVLVIGVAALVVAAGGGAWFYVAHSRAVLISQLPAEPDLSGVAEPLRRRIQQAENGSVSKLRELSRLYHANGYYREAVQCYELLEKAEPNDPRWMHRHATILAGYGESEIPLQLWRKVVALAPDYLPARLRLAELLLKTNHKDEAVAAYREVLQRKPDEPYALLNLARIDIENGDWDSARKRLEVVVAQTNYQLGYDLIVTVLEHFGEYDAATAIRARDKASGAYRDMPDPWVDELIDDCFDPYRLSTVAGFVAGRGDTVGATALLQKAADLAPDDPMPHFQLGLMAEQRGDKAAAAEQFERCTTLSPTFSDPWAHLSAIQAQSGDQTAADRTLLEGLQHCPNSPGLHLMHARSLRKIGHIGEAIAAFRNSIRLRPNEPDAYIELGNMLISQGRTGEGVAELKASLDALPDNPGALTILTYYAITTNNESEAKQWLARVGRQPRIPQAQVAQLLGAYRQQFGHDYAP
jgi:tetratricopeptide (TPR) repeat protein